MTAEERAARVCLQWANVRDATLVRLIAAAIDETIEEERGHAKADMAHARRSLKQACLFAAESVRLDDSRWAGHIQDGFIAGVRAAADAVASVEVE